MLSFFCGFEKSEHKEPIIVFFKRYSQNLVVDKTET